MYAGKVVVANSFGEHSNADRLKLLFLGSEQFIISKDMEVGTVVVLFPSDGELSHDFLHYNNLYRDSSKNADSKKKGFFEDTRRVRAQPFRGEKSSGFVATLDMFDYLGNFLATVGDDVDSWNGDVICKKYYTRATLRAMRNIENNKAKKKLVEYGLDEHFSTKKYSYYPPRISSEAIVFLTEKVHGTSARTGNVLVNRTHRNFLQRWFDFGGRVTSEYELVSGTRRTIVNERQDITTAGERDHYRWEWHETIAPLLYKGETVYYEIAGFDSWGAGIMDTQDISSRDDVQPYWGDRMVYRYGCEDGENRAFVYRITNTTPDGNVIDLSWNQVVARSRQLGLENVPVLDALIPKNEEHLEGFVNSWMHNLDSTLDNRHMMEGVVIRIEDGLSVTVLKEKNHLFGILEGYLKEQSDYVDVEEVN